MQRTSNNQGGLAGRRAAKRGLRKIGSKINLGTILHTSVSPNHKLEPKSSYPRDPSIPHNLQSYRRVFSFSSRGVNLTSPYHKLRSLTCTCIFTMVNALDKRTLGAKKGGIERSIANLQEANKPVPKSKSDKLKAVERRDGTYRQ